eukprot:50906_1
MITVPSVASKQSFLSLSLVDHPCRRRVDGNCCCCTMWWFCMVVGYCFCCMICVGYKQWFEGKFVSPTAMNCGSIATKESTEPAMPICIVFNGERGVNGSGHLHLMWLVSSVVVVSFVQTLLQWPQTQPYLLRHRCHNALFEVHRFCVGTHYCPSHIVSASMSCVVVMSTVRNTSSWCIQCAILIATVYREWYWFALGCVSSIIFTSFSIRNRFLWFDSGEMDDSGTQSSYAT